VEEEEENKAEHEKLIIDTIVLIGVLKV